MDREPYITVDKLTFQYHSRTEPAISDISFKVYPGEVLLIAGSSGCGKTTLMRCINGLIPHTYRGDMSGEIRLLDKPVSEMAMSDLSQTVGTLLQDPERQIVGSYVRNEVAFGLENLGFSREEIIRRVDETLEYLGILHLRDRETFSISGGEKQKVALAGVLVMQPKVLLLDEPLASLDPSSAHEALKLFRDLADKGIAVVIVEHRVEDVLSINPDRVLYLDAGKQEYYGDSSGLMKVVDYHRIKLPARIIMERAKTEQVIEFKPLLSPQAGEALVKFDHVSFRYREDLPDVLHDVSFQVGKGDVIAILGHNGAGKTTLVKHALGLLKPTDGRVLLEGKDTRKVTVAQAAHTIGYVFQSPTQMLFAPSVKEELAFGPKNLRYTPDTIQKNVDWAIHTVHMEAELETPPLALSFGQQKRVSIASILSMRSRILMMDEPTAGQDYWNYNQFMDAILQMPGFDSVLFITHDVDLAVVYANRILLVFGGQIVADGSPAEVLKDKEQLRRCRVLPTTLLQVNEQYYEQTGRFLRAEELAKRI
ncbi:ABC transporter ATP-binding protein [Leptolinea tardivitalis]|uniref:ABC transporter ATP-binding protein n=1 Tax=Leptolinea tardivitalis TaxID=229920 RepID=UPI000783CD3A|nr:ABC transporter ATP-binding protein [Leptolinea tardivitalis]GAP22136.1 ATPase components of various ABC-type transport systems, contain duplicated ATPase [Leptolinea tardivitalis]